MEFLDRLSKSIECFEDSADKISQVSELLTVVRKLIEEIENENEKLEESKQKIDQIKNDISKETQAVEQLIRQNDDRFEKTIITLKEELLKSKKENLDAIDSILAAISNKLTVTQSNIEAVFTNKSSNIEKILRDSSEDISELKKKILQIKTLVLISVTTSILGFVGIAGIVISNFLYV